LESYQCVE